VKGCRKLLLLNLGRSTAFFLFKFAAMDALARWVALWAHLAAPDPPPGAAAAASQRWRACVAEVGATAPRLAAAVAAAAHPSPAAQTPAALQALAAALLAVAADPRTPVASALELLDGALAAPLRARPALAAFIDAWLRHHEAAAAGQAPAVAVQGRRLEVLVWLLRTAPPRAARAAAAALAADGAHDGAGGLLGRLLRGPLSARRVGAPRVRRAAALLVALAAEAAPAALATAWAPLDAALRAGEPDPEVLRALAAALFHGAAAHAAAMVPREQAAAAEALAAGLACGAPAVQLPAAAAAARALRALPPGGAAAARLAAAVGAAAAAAEAAAGPWAPPWAADAGEAPAVGGAAARPAHVARALRLLQAEVAAAGGAVPALPAGC
jgi:hypothetical protein